MKNLWCWRCKMEVPMLDKKEFEIAQKLYSLAFKSRGNSLKERFKPLTDYYFDITGFTETNQNAIMHHAIEQYGPTCAKCSKPYRTPEAVYCAACGNNR